jgi:hypothetical protein
MTPPRRDMMPPNSSALLPDDFWHSIFGRSILAERVGVGTIAVSVGQVAGDGVKRAAGCSGVGESTGLTRLTFCWRGSQAPCGR